MIKLFAHPSQSVLKVQIALQEMNLPYTLVNDRTLIEGTADYEQFYQASPTGQVPAIYDSETGAALFESAAILMYLAEKTGQFLPAPNQPAKRAEVIKWLMFEAAGLTPAMLDIYHFTLETQKDHPYAERRARTRAKRVLAALNGALGVPGRDYLAGEYSIADMIVYPWLAILEEFTNIPPSEFPRLQAWAERVGARPAVKMAEGK